MPHCQVKSKRGKDVEPTNIGSLDHTDVVSSITNTAYTLLGMFPDKTSDISLLGRRTPACNHGRKFGGDLDELVSKQVQAELGESISLESQNEDGPIPGEILRR